MKVLILILLFPLLAQAQYPSPLPASGTITFNQIFNWMLAAKEMPLTETQASLGDERVFYESIKLLNEASHLTDKTATFNISDWYGYARNDQSNPFGMDSVIVDANYKGARNAACSGCSTPVNCGLKLFFTPPLAVGTIMYRRKDRTGAALYNGSYAGVTNGARFYIYVDSIGDPLPGEVVEIGTCIN